MTNETSSTPTAEQVGAQQQQQQIANHPLAIRSWFEPGTGFTIGFGARADETSSPEKMMAKISFEDLAVAERDLESVLTHLRDSIRSVIANNSYTAGRTSVVQEQAMMSKEAEQNAPESAKLKLVEHEASSEQSVAKEDVSESSEPDYSDPVINLDGAAKSDA